MIPSMAQLTESMKRVGFNQSPVLRKDVIILEAHSICLYTKPSRLRSAIISCSFSSIRWASASPLRSWSYPARWRIPCNRKKQKTFHVISDVYFRDLNRDEIDYYIENFRPFDKAGGYGIQEWIGYIGISKIEGSYFNIMGLPVKELYEELLAF